MHLLRLHQGCDLMLHSGRCTRCTTTTCLLVMSCTYANTHVQIWAFWHVSKTDYADEHTASTAHIHKPGSLHAAGGPGVHDPQT